MLSLPAPQRDLLTMQLAQRACTLNEALGGNEADIIGFEQAACALKQGFEQVLNLQFKPGQLTPQEARRTAELLREQYANSEWTQVR